MPNDRELAPYSTERNVPSPYVRHGGAEAAPGVNLRRTWLVLYKRQYLIVGTVLVVCLLAILSERAAPRTYVASSQIRIDPVTPGLANDLASLLVNGSYYKTTHVLLASPSLARRVIETLKLYDDPRFTEPPKPTGVFGQIEAAIFDVWNRINDSLRSLMSAKPKSEPSPAAGAPADDPAQKLVDRYLAGLTVSPVENSSLVTISYTATDPELAAAIANAHGKEFSKMTVEARIDVNEDAQQVLEQRLAELKKRTEESEGKLNEFRRRHRVLAVGGNEKENVALERLASLNADYAKAQTERIAAEADYNLVKRRQYDQLASMQRDSTYNTLKEQLEQLKSEYGRLSQVYLPSYPKMVALAGQIGGLEKRVADQVHKGVAGVESQYLAAKAKEDALAAEIERTRKDVLDLNDLSVEYQVLARGAEADRQLYTTLISRSKEASIAATVEATNVRVVDPARVPKDASLLGFRRSLSRAAFLGLLFGVCLAFGLEYLDSTIKTPEDAEEFLKVPSLAVVPSFSYQGPTYGAGLTGRRWWRPLGRSRRRQRKSSPILLTAPEEADASTSSRLPVPKRSRTAGRKASTASELMVIDRPSSAIAEAYRTLRTAMLLSSADNPPRVIQMVSAASREGKTVTSVNTALTLAQSGASVLLLDADLRRPRCHTIFGVSRVPGLVDHLVGHCELEKCIYRLTIAEGVTAMHGVPGAHHGNGNGHGNGKRLLTGTVDLLPVGSKAPNPAELLGSVRMRETLSMLRERYDFLIVDSPPVLPVADSIVLCTLADAV
ncbi:MAG: GumC family protein, partial [Candidatus Binatia bacterium]